MAIKVSTAARGDAKATGMPKTPKGRTFTTGPALQERSSGGAYGDNHYTGASSTTMDKVPVSPMAAALKVADDGVLSALVAKGVKGGTGDLAGSPQCRTVDEKGYPAAFGQRFRQASSGSPGGTIPAKIGVKQAR